MQKVALVIDDEEEICHLLVRYLRKKNYKSYFSLTLKDGIERCRVHKPDIIFLDNNLPDGSGIADISKIRQLSNGSRIIVISAMTNLADSALAAGAFAFIGKPISFQTIDLYLS